MAVRMILAVALSLVCRIALADTIDSLMSVYVQADGDEKIAVANEIFVQYRNDGFTDFDITFTDDDYILGSNVNFWYGEYCYEKSDFETARKYSLLALPYFEEGGIDSEIADCHNSVAVSSIHLGDYLAAIAHLNKCYELDLRTGDEARISSSLNSLADLYLTIGQPEAAKNYILQSLEIEQRLKRSAPLAIRYGKVSQVYSRLGDNDLALKYARRAFELDSTDGRTLKVAIRQSQMAEIYIALGKTDTALNCLIACVNVFDSLKSDDHLATALNQLGRVWLEKGSIDKAISCYDRALVIGIALGSKPLQRNAHNGLWRCYRNTDIEKALCHLEYSSEIADSLYVEGTQQALCNYRIKFDTEALERSNIAKSQENRLIITISVILAVIFMLAIAALMYALRVKSKSQKLLQRLEHTRTAFFTNVTHEFRTPLTVILGMAQRLRSNTPHKGESPEFIGQMIERQGNTLLELINRLLDISRVKSAIGEPKRISSDIVAHIRMLTETIAEAAKEKDINFTVQLDEQVVIANYVPDYLDKILNNLLSNAIKYTSEGGRVSFKCSFAPKTMVITVDDTGQGIPADALPHVFRHFL